MRGSTPVSHDQFRRETWLEAAITEDPSVLDGHKAHDEKQLLEIFDAVSEVFPNDPFPFEGFEQFRSVRQALDALDPRFRMQSGSSRSPELRAEGDRLYRHTLEVFEADLRLSRKHKLARMALTRDWSGMSSYIREGVVMWKCRMLLRSGALRSSVRLDRAQRATAVAHTQTSAPSPARSLVLLPKPVRHSELRSSLERLGVVPVKSCPSAAIRTGSLALDEALQIGGFPRGRIVEIFGKEGTGKTTLALATAANAQRNGAIAYVDAEHKLDLPWARVNGLNVEEALILQATRAKDTMDSVLQLIRSGDFALVVVDSLTGLFPGEDLEQSDGEFTGEMDRLFARALPRIASAAGRTQTCVLLLNQVRDNEEPFGRPTISTAGRALAHHASIRLELSRLMARKNEGDILGYGVKGTVVKSCVGSPYRVAEWSINFERGIDVKFELIEQGIRRGVISRQTVDLKFGEEHLGASVDAAREFILQRPDVAALLEAELRATMNRVPGMGRNEP
ncbi:MAG: ATPase domain-containing protein [Bryobacteraceae bacterium]